MKCCFTSVKQLFLYSYLGSYSTLYLPKLIPNQVLQKKKKKKKIPKENSISKNSIVKNLLKMFSVCYYNFLKLFSKIVEKKVLES